MNWPVHSVCLGMAFAGCVHAAETDLMLSQAPDILINVEEPIFVDDAVEITAALLLSLEERIKISDLAIPAPSLLLRVEEAITANDSVLPTPAFVLNIFEQIQVDESVDINLPLRLNLLETIAVNDEVILTPGLKLLISENILLHDGVQHSIQTPPQVLFSRSIAGLSGLGITAASALHGAVTELEIAYSVPMKFSTGNAVDAANIANYRLLSSSTNGVVFPTDCNDPLPPAVAAIDVQMHGYIESDQTVVLRSKRSTGFTSAFYQLIACSAGIQSELGTELDGDADLLAGGDYAIAFSVSADNLLQNPNFSNGSNHWNLSGSASVSQLDADSATIAGSILLDETVSRSEVNQCVDLGGPGAINASAMQLGASLYSDDRPGTVEIGIEFFSKVACSGVSLQQKSEQQTTQADEWLDTSLISKAPSGALSARVYVANPPGAPALVFDRSYLVPFSDLIFSNGFEDGKAASKPILMQSPAIQNYP